MAKRKSKKQGAGFPYLILGAIFASLYLVGSDVDLRGFLHHPTIQSISSQLSIPNGHNQQAPTKVLQGRVVAIADGDTITVLDEHNRQHKVRLAGIDAPESKQPFGQRARGLLAELCFNRFVTIDIQQTDRYGRLVGWVIADGQNVNHRLVADGLAWHYKQYDKSVELAALEATARMEQRGLWSDPHPIEPWKWRRRGRSQ